MQTLTGPSVE